MVQVMPEQDADTYSINPFDLTKVWPHADYSLIEVGIMELSRNPENHFAEVEQAAFEPGNAPPGMGPSPDKMLQARLLSYPDAHRYRIGINYAALDVNKPRCPVHTYHRDGQTRFDGNNGRGPNYRPNSFGGAVDNPAVAEPPLKISDDAARHDHRVGNDDTTQAGNLYRMMGVDERSRLAANLVSAMKTVPQFIQERQIAHFHKADPEYGRRVAEGLGFRIEDVMKQAA